MPVGSSIIIQLVLAVHRYYLIVYLTTSTYASHLYSIFHPTTSLPTTPQTILLTLLYYNTIHHSHIPSYMYPIEIGQKWHKTETTQDRYNSPNPTQAESRQSKQRSAESIRILSKTNVSLKARSDTGVSDRCRALGEVAEVNQYRNLTLCPLSLISSIKILTYRIRGSWVYLPFCLPIASLDHVICSIGSFKPVSDRRHDASLELFNDLTAWQTFQKWF